MRNSYDSTIFTMKSLGTHGYPKIAKARVCDVQKERAIPQLRPFWEFRVGAQWWA